MSIRTVIPQLGEPVTSAHQLVSVPNRTIIRNGPTDRWIKRPDGRFNRLRENVEREDGYSASDFVMSGVSVVEYPDGFEVPEPRQITVEAFKQELATVVMGSAVGAGVSLSPVEQALGALDVPVRPEAAMAGMAIDYSDSYLRGRITNTVLTQVGDPAIWPGFTVYRLGPGGDFQTILGSNHVVSRVSMIREQDGLQRWAPAFDTGTDEDKAAIAQLRSQAWAIGIKAKQANSWCGEYEAAMARMGITEACLIREPGTVGATVHGAAVRELPIGTVVHFTNDTDPERWYFFIRTDQSTNTQGLTRLFIGPEGRPTAQYAGREADYTIVAQPGERVPLTDNRWVRALPVGSWISDDTNANGYQKIEEDRWRTGTRTARRTATSGTEYEPRTTGATYDSAAFRNNFYLARINGGEWLR